MPDHISQLDTQRFGFNIAKINDVARLTDSAFIKELKEQEVRLVITRIDSKRLDELNVLEDLGFRIKDVQLGYRLDLSDQLVVDRRYANDDIRIREAAQRDIPSFRHIAAEAFDNYGHYFADARLDKTRCRDLYQDWAERTITDKTVSEKTFVAESNNEPIGFISFRILEKEGKRYGASSIGAVAKAFRGHNVFSSLVIKGIDWGMENNLAWEEHNVLVINHPVNRVLAKLGCRQIASFTTLHGWLDS